MPFSRHPRDLATARFRGVLVILALTGASGCASHSESLVRVREALVAGDPARAFQIIEKKKSKPDDLLALLERGYLAHEAGAYDSSNAILDAAELLHEELYTKSISGELASLVTNDRILPYRGYPHELVMLHYYRAFNYLKLDKIEDALVEARKANQRLAKLQDDNEGKTTYKNDAFMQYFTGLLYEREGEHNDATVSYRDAYRGYEEYASLYGATAPPGLASNLYAALNRVGAETEASSLVERNPGIESESALRMRSNAVLFIETGFVPYLEPVDITIPILGEEDSRFRDCAKCADDYAGVLASRYDSDIYTWRRRRLKVDHVLRFSFPMMVNFPSPIAHVGLVCSVGTAPNPALAQPLDAIVHRSFSERVPKLLLKTVARALVKEFARVQAKKEDVALGALVNIINVATEQADTRSCLFLPGSIWVAEMELPPGEHTFDVVMYDGADAVVERLPITVTVPENGVAIARVRSFR